MRGMTQTYIALYAIDIIALIFLYGLLHNNNLLNNQRKRTFTYGILFTIVVILSEIGTMIAFNEGTSFRVLNIVCNVLGFALTPLIPIVLISIFNTKMLLKQKIMFLPTVLNMIIVILSPMYGFIFYVNANNVYTRGSLFFVFVGVYIVNIILLLIVTLDTCQKSLYPIKWKIVSLTFFTVFGTFIQLLAPTVYSSWHLVTLSLFLLYILLSEFDSSFDSLTSLHSRAAFEKAIKQLNEKKSFSIIVMDINDFKEINDTYGHEYGDNVLREVAAIVREAFDSNCSWYRIGGDELCIISKDTSQEKLERQLKHMTDNLSKERVNDTCLPTVAYGYRIFTGDGPFDFLEIMRDADTQMYYYKKIQKEKEILAAETRQV